MRPWLTVTGALGAPEYVCADCGRDATGRRPTASCLCGSTYRLRADPGDSYRVITERARPWFDPFKDWTVKYLQFEWNVTQLRAVYRTGQDDATAVRSAQAALRACVEVAEWLTARPEPRSVTPGALARFLAADPLCVAAGYTRLVPVAFAKPPRVWVDYQPAGGKPSRYDALDLVERCECAWREFLAARGVIAPAW